MQLLAIDTSSSHGSIAMIRGDRPLAEHDLALDRKASTTLLPAINRLFEETGLKRSDLEALVVGLGPGSFTGIRIGLSTVQGIAQALNLPVYGVPSLLSLAYPVREKATSIAVVRPARPGEVYFASYRGRHDWGQVHIKERRLTGEEVIENLMSAEINLLLEEDEALKYLADRLPGKLSRLPVHMSAASLAATALHTPGIEPSPGGLELKPHMYGPGYRKLNT